MKKRVFTILFFIAIISYAIITFINQQITLNRYNEEQLKLSKQIEEANEYKKELTVTKENVNSEEFIEQAAREKLDMYLPTETVYVDAGI